MDRELLKKSIEYHIFDADRINTEISIHNMIRAHIDKLNSTELNNLIDLEKFHLEHYPKKYPLELLQHLLSNIDKSHKIYFFVKSAIDYGMHYIYKLSAYLFNESSSEEEIITFVCNNIFNLMGDAFRFKIKDFLEYLVDINLITPDIINKYPFNDTTFEYYSVIWILDYHLKYQNIILPKNLINIATQYLIHSSESVTHIINNIYNLNEYYDPNMPLISKFFYALNNGNDYPIGNLVNVLFNLHENGSITIKNHENFLPAIIHSKSMDLLDKYITYFSDIIDGEVSSIIDNLYYYIDKNISDKFINTLFQLINSASDKLNEKDKELLSVCIVKIYAINPNIARNIIDHYHHLINFSLIICHVLYEIRPISYYDYFMDCANLFHYDVKITPYLIIKYINRHDFALAFQIINTRQYIFDMLKEITYADIYVAETQVNDFFDIIHMKDILEAFGHEWHFGQDELNYICAYIADEEIVKILSYMVCELKLGDNFTFDNNEFIRCLVNYSLTCTSKWLIENGFIKGEVREDKVYLHIKKIEEIN